MRKTIGHKWEIDFDALVHALISGVGSAICVYLNIFAAVQMTGISGKNVNCALMICRIKMSYRRLYGSGVFVNAFIRSADISFSFYIQNHLGLFNAMARLQAFIV